MTPEPSPPVPADGPLSISDAEWRVMRAAWDAERDDPPGTVAAAVIAAVTPVTGWSHRTVRTLLARLVKKGALTAEPDPAAPRRHRYRAAVSERQCVQAEGRSFLERVFGGNVGAALVHFAEGAELTPAQADELRRLLDEAESKGAGDD
ncbi:BlaI/MecI/CopY family transcriptional regulator [Alienimonas sp. DA493]|uniref:BlaI/MecI/CopY family transcriptional regulator n=1 Tax=Alienimonas sp. DA493 TaxID=3373605 RepID=UPI003754954C